MLATLRASWTLDIRYLRKIHECRCVEYDAFIHIRQWES
jgi:hypothetical protein